MDVLKDLLVILVNSVVWLSSVWLRIDFPGWSHILSPGIV